MSNPIRRLNSDLSRLHQAKSTQSKDKGALRKVERDLARLQKELKKDRKAGDKEHVALNKQLKSLEKLRAALSAAQTSESDQLAQLDAEKAQLQQQYQDSFDPNDPASQGDPALLAQLDAVSQQETDLKTTLDAKVAADQQKVTGQATTVGKLRDAIKAKRGEITSDRKGIKGDRTGIKKDNKKLKTDASRIKNDRRRALKDLKPAEYKMGLKGTNKARSALGLKKVSQVIRPGVPNVVGGQVGKWIAQAQTILKQHGVPLSRMNARDIAIIIQHESAGNPRAVNNWDSNAAAGTPSEGLMQTIGPTFNSYKLPGHNQILNPVDNIIAGVRYAISRYGSISNVPGVRAVHRGGAYVGY